MSDHPLKSLMDSALEGLRGLLMSILLSASRFSHLMVL